MSERGEIPAAALDNIKAKAGFDVKTIDEIEKTTKHDVIAFLTNVGEHVGPSARYIHRGLTSSDILDTALAVQMTQAVDILIRAVKAVRVAAKPTPKVSTRGRPVASTAAPARVALAAR
jgi:adenylosuccinate lyase